MGYLDDTAAVVIGRWRRWRPENAHESGDLLERVTYSESGERKVRDRLPDQAVNPEPNRDESRNRYHSDYQRGELPRIKLCPTGRLLQNCNIAECSGMEYTPDMVGFLAGAGYSYNVLNKEVQVFWNRKK